MFETRTAVVTLDDGTVVVRVRAGARQSVADAQANLAAALQTGAGLRKRPVLVDIRVAVPLDHEVRRYYSGQVLDGFSAMALLVNASPLGRMIGNVYLRVANTRIPTRLFADEASAHAWLRNHS